MTSPIPPYPTDRESANRHRGLSPPVKIFLAGSIITLGLTVAGFQLRPVHEPLDKAISQLSGPLHNKEAQWDAPIIMKTGEKSAQMSQTEGVANIVPVSPPASPATGTGKYAQAYPKPVLEPDESLKRSLGAKETIEVRGNTPFLVTSVEFKPLHQIPSSGPVRVQESYTDFKPKPTAVPTRQTFDALLPLFHFATNASSLDESVMPTNPFSMNENQSPAIPALVPLRLMDSEVSGRNSANKLIPLLQNDALVPLRP